MREDQEKTPNEAYFCSWHSTNFSTKISWFTTNRLLSPAVLLCSSYFQQNGDSYWKKKTFVG